jgi:hypothetical protein
MTGCFIMLCVIISNCKLFRYIFFNPQGTPQSTTGKMPHKFVSQSFSFFHCMKLMLNGENTVAGFHLQE